MKQVIPEEVWKQHVAILAKTGRGKTVAAKGGATALMTQGVRCGVVDPTAAWWGMRLKPDGKTQAFPMVIFGGDHADIHIDARMGNQNKKYDPRENGEKIGALVAASEWSWILDISKLGADHRAPFMTGFAEALFAGNRRRLNLFLDECHLYMPQQKLPTKASAHMTAACNNLVSGGRSRGLCITMISQRSAKVHKDSLTQAETLITLGMIAPQDIAAAKAWIEVQGDLKAAREMLQSLPGLPRGEGWIYAPELSMLKHVKFPMVDTFDSSRAPEVGEALHSPTVLAKIDLEEIRTKLMPGPSFSAFVAPLTKQTTGPVHIVSDATMVLHTKEITRLTTEAAARGRSEGFLAGHETGFRDGYAHAQTIFELHAVDIRKALTDTSKLFGDKTVYVPRDIPKKFASIVQGSEHPPVTREVAGSNPAGRATTSTGNLPVGERAVLTAAVQFGSVSREHLTILTGYKRSSRDAFIQRLKTKNLLYALSDDALAATEEGEAVLGEYERMPTGVALQGFWLNRLPGGEAKILTFLLENYPRAVQRSEIDDATDFKRSSRDAYLQRMKAKRLWVEEDGGVKAAPNLF